MTGRYPIHTGKDKFINVQESHSKTQKLKTFKIKTTGVSQRQWREIIWKEDLRDICCSTRVTQRQI